MVMKTTIRSIAVLLVVGIFILDGRPAEAQQKGQSAKISHGIVVGIEQVDLNNSKSTQGALLGGGIALAASSGKSGKSKRRNTAGGAIVGGLIGSKAGGKQMGMMYTVGVAGGAVKVVTDQTEIKMDDCVVVEESGQGANIRRVSNEVCNPASQDVVADLQDEFLEEAEECVAAKTEVADAETDEQVELAMKKVSILCN
jgi:hypothetical protein